MAVRCMLSVILGFLWILPGVTAAADVVVEELYCSTQEMQGGGLNCSTSTSSTALAREHQLLQFGAGKLQVAQSAQNVEKEQGEQQQRVPGQFTCEGMKDVEKVCSDDGCKVLATHMQRKTCKEYCAANGRTCVWAAEEVDETCGVKAPLHCDQAWGSTSDLLCQCSAGPSKAIGQAPATPSDLAELQLVWSDEFDGNSVDTGKWSLDSGGGGFGNRELQYYSSRPANAQVANGVLSITARCESYKGHGFTSAKLETKHKGDWGPGHRVDIRARVPKGKGTWPAIWMLPTEAAYGSWPRSGEIDIMEAIGCTADKVYGTVHTEVYNHMLHTEKYNTLHTDVGAWHVYTIEWTESRISWYLDGHLFHSFAPDSYEHGKWPYNREFHLILNVAVGGAWGGYCLHGRPSCSAADEFGQPQVMEVDYARVYAL